MHKKFVFLQTLCIKIPIGQMAFYENISTRIETCVLFIQCKVVSNIACAVYRSFKVTLLEVYSYFSWFLCFMSEKLETKAN